MAGPEAAEEVGEGGRGEVRVRHPVGQQLAVTVVQALVEYIIKRWAIRLLVEIKR
jgi:hypothetical protein